jgi:hypothetical protein
MLWQVVLSDTTFSVSCYHMPCAFRDPPLMVIHCALAAQRAEFVARKAGGGTDCVPYVLAGGWWINTCMYPASSLVQVL